MYRAQEPLRASHMGARPYVNSRFAGLHQPSEATAPWQIWMTQEHVSEKDICKSPDIP